jgi:hypothetical protein
MRTRSAGPGASAGGGDPGAPARPRDLAAADAECPGTRINDRVTGATEDLEALARDLDDDELVLDPAAAVACVRLLSDRVQSPLLDADSHAEDVRSRVRQIRSGFDRRHATA